MKEILRIKLWNACFNKSLFKKELEEIVGNTSRQDIFEVLKYCYDKYSDMYADVLLEVFNNYENKQRQEVGKAC